MMTALYLLFTVHAALAQPLPQEGPAKCSIEGQMTRLQSALCARVKELSDRLLKNQSREFDPTSFVCNLSGRYRRVVSEASHMDYQAIEFRNAGISYRSYGGAEITVRFEMDYGYNLKRFAPNEFALVSLNAEAGRCMASTVGQLKDPGAPLRELSLTFDGAQRVEMGPIQTGPTVGTEPVGPFEIN